MAKNPLVSSAWRMGRCHLTLKRPFSSAGQRTGVLKWLGGGGNIAGCSLHRISLKEAGNMLITAFA